MPVFAKQNTGTDKHKLSAPAAMHPARQPMATEFALVVTVEIPGQKLLLCGR